MLEAEQIQKNYDKHLKIIDTYLGGRAIACKEMLKHMEDTYVMAPASGKSWYHNAFAGGYVDHVNRVVQYAIEQHKLYGKMGGTVDYTEEELVLAYGVIVNPKKSNQIFFSEGDKIIVISEEEQVA